jgi:hypothetical protein
MTIIAGPSVVNSATSGLIYYIDPGNSKSYSSAENLYPTSENWGLMLTSSTPSSYYQVSTGGPYGGPYYVTTVTSTISSNYWFEWGNTVYLNAGDTVTQTYHIRPITTSAGTLQTVGLQFWNGAGRAWTTYRYASFTLGTTASVYYTSGGTSTASISLLDNGWYRISQTATTDQAGYSGMSLYVSGNVGFNTGTIYHFAAAQIEKNAQFTGYVPTYGSAQNRGTSLIDITGINTTATTFFDNNGISFSPIYVPSNGGNLNFGAINYANNNLTPAYGYIISPIPTNYFSATSDLSITTWVNFGTTYSTLTNVMGTLAGSMSFNGWGIQWFGGTSQYQINTWIRTTVGIVSVFGGDAVNQTGTGTGGSGGWTVNTSTWYNVGMVYSTLNNYHAMYLNGKLIGTASPALTTGTFALTNPNFNIGSANGAGGGATQVSFPGSFGPTMLWNRALTAAEVQQLFNAHRGRYGV